MEQIGARSSLRRKKKTKLATTFRRVINLKAASKNGICILTSQSKHRDSSTTCGKSQSSDGDEDAKARRRAIMEALVAKLFAEITSIKAAYAELQIAQNPYNGLAIQSADQAVVDELKSISELKRSYLKKELHLSPQVTFMLSEIQEQQSLMKTYQITIKKLEAESEMKDLELVLLQKQLGETTAFNKSAEKKLNFSGSISMFDNFQFSSLTPTHFVMVLHYALKSIRNFVKIMTNEMESSRWDLDIAVKFIVESDSLFAEPSHRIFAFESFVCKTMFEGFSYPCFTFQTASSPLDHDRRINFFEEFKNLKPINPRNLLSRNPSSLFSKFTLSKYLKLVHAKMECSLFGNLNQRKIVKSGGIPESEFFTAFSEVSKRVWLLHCLAFSMDEEINIFLVKKNKRFSEMYMESVTPQSTFSFSDFGGDDGDDVGKAASVAGPKVRFTVVPGFRFGKTVIQSRVYLSPLRSTRH